MMENKPKPMIKRIDQVTNKKTWKAPSIELIGRNLIESGHTIGAEGKHYTGGSNSITVYGEGNVS